MDIAKAYQLWYTGAAKHEVFYETMRQVKIDTALAGLKSGTVTGKQMAERILDNVAFIDEKLDVMKAASGQQNYELTKMHGRDIDKVHRIKEEEIKGTWDVPEITEQQLADALFADAVAPLLDELPKGSVDVDLGGA